MTLIEALKSGRPFRRTGTEGWKSKVIGKSLPDTPLPGVTLGDLLANDWEVKEPEVHITASQFWEKGRAAIKAVEERTGYKLLTAFPPPIPQDVDLLVELARQLGLKDD